MSNSDSTDATEKAPFDLKGRMLVGVFYGLSLLPLSVCRKIGASLGWLLWRLNQQPAKVTRDNLRFAFPELSKAALERLTRASMIHSGQTGAEMGLLWKRGDRWVDSKIVSVVNFERVVQQVEAGLGVMILAPHIGNWELVGRFLGVHYPLTAMYQPAALPSVDRLIRNGRERNMQLAPTDRTGIVRLVKALRRGELVGILPDQVPTAGAGEFADFFGKPALTMTLVRQLQKKTGCPVVMAQANRIRGGFEIVFSEPHPDLFDQDPAVALAGLNRSVEQVVNSACEQYQWEYKRYRRQPPGMPRPYQYKKGRIS